MREFTCVRKKWGSPGQWKGGLAETTPENTSKWIQDFSIRPETIKHLKENTGRTLYTIGLGDDFFNQTPKARKATINKWDYIKPRSLCTVKETIYKMKWQPTKWDKKFANHTSNKELITKIYE